MPALFAITQAKMLSALPSWWSPFACLSVLDIAAGGIANFTRSTNDLYAERPRNHWALIALHIHMMAAAMLIGSHLTVVIAV